MSLSVILMLLFTAVTGDDTASLTVRLGHDVTLPCGNVIKDQQKCDSTSWLFSRYIGSTAVELVTLGNISKNEKAKAKAKRLNVSEDCSLVIKSVTHDDVGRYTCRQIRSGEQVSEARVLLNVINITSDDAYRFYCVVFRFGVCAHTVQWYYKGDETDISEHQQSICTAIVSFKTHVVQKSNFNELLYCKVTDNKSGQTLLCNAFSKSSCEKTDTTGSTSTGGDEMKEDDKPNWLPYVIVAAGLAAFLIILIVVVAFIRRKRTKGNKTQTDKNIAEHEDIVAYASISYTKKGNSRAQKSRKRSECLVTWSEQSDGRRGQHERMDQVLLSIIAVSGLCALYTHAGRQYHFVYEAKNMTEALSYCRDKYTDLASIDNMEDVELLNTEADSNRMVSYSHLAWIGLYDDVESWRWSLSDRSFYKPGESTFRHWSSREPNNVHSVEHCGQMYSNGLWNDEPCERLYKPVCSDVTGSNVTFVLINTNMSWTEAQSYCREHHTDLASVRNLDENQKIKELISGLTVWIGFSRETWKWTDGRNSSFRFWKKNPPEPNNNYEKETCVAAYFEDSGRWEDWPCHYKRASICYRDASLSQRVVKVRLVKRSSSLDLNDAAVMDAMLKQLKQKLKDQGLKEEDVKLSWRKQADGKVFHKEEKKKKMITKPKDELCSPFQSAAAPSSPLQPLPVLCSPFQTSAAPSSPLQPLPVLCSPFQSSAASSSPLIPFQSAAAPSSLLQPLPVLCSPFQTSAAPSSPLQPLPVLCSPFQTSAAPSSPLQPLPVLCSPFQSSAAPSSQLQPLPVRCSLFQSSAAPSSPLQPLPVSCSPFQSSAAPSSPLQPLPVLCSPFQSAAAPSSPRIPFQSAAASSSPLIPIQSAAASSSQLQPLPVSCSLFQSAAASSSPLQPLPVLCSPFQSAHPLPVRSSPSSLLQPLLVRSSPSSPLQPLPSAAASSSPLQPLPVRSSPSSPLIPFQSAAAPSSPRIPFQSAAASSSPLIPIQSAAASSSQLQPLPVSCSLFQSAAASSSPLQPLPVLCSPFQSAHPLPVRSSPSSLLQPLLVRSSPSSPLQPLPVSCSLFQSAAASSSPLQPLPVLCSLFQSAAASSSPLIPFQSAHPLPVCCSLFQSAAASSSPLQPLLVCSSPSIEHKTLERTKRVEAATVKSPQRVPETHEDYRRIRTSGLCAESPQVKRRYFFNYDHKTRDEARAFCRDKHTDLATITSMEDVDTLRGMADLSQMWQIVDGNRAWIGLYDDVDSWSWSLSDPSFYDDGEAEFRQWAGGMPDNIGSREHCTTMYFDGLWNDVHCMDNLKSVCCDATGPNVTFVLISTDMSWTEAQSYCREHHTDLASVRNLDENQKIKELIPFLQSVWIGLSRETWKWLDGSNSSFRYWNLGFSDPNNLFSKEACVSADFGNFGKWEDWPCGYKRSYICYTAGITQQVIRVSVQKKKNPSVDLNHSAVMEHILQQLRQKLRDEGLHENIRLSWRRQPGGNVFQKEESEEKKETPEC
ncbi:uncharacterized protein [Labrus bergylta]|uniref:uncharacterized protein n=1 Tax=Labrus bergylta TaxID=56723 RepID=UPI0033142F95